MGIAAEGYPTSGLGARLLLVLSHIVLFPSMAIAWGSRDETPWLIVALTGCLVASTQYHLCYSFDVCYFDDRRLHRQLDHYFSGMIVPVLLTQFLWHRRWLVDGKDPFSPSTYTYMSTYTGTPPKAPGVASRRLEFYRPLVVDPLVLALYAANLFIHVQQGIDHYGSTWVIAGAALIAAGANASEVVASGLKFRPRVALLVFAPLTIGYAAFQLDDELGAGGHSVWHDGSMLAVFLYLWQGPFFTPADGIYLRPNDAALRALGTRVRGWVPARPAWARVPGMGPGVQVGGPV